jgi:hypothetical protein
MSLGVAVSAALAVVSPIKGNKPATTTTIMIFLTIVSSFKNVVKVE